MNAVVSFTAPNHFSPGASPVKPALPVPTSEAGRSVNDNLATYIKGCFEEARNFRQREGINNDLLEALRSVRGEYDPDTASAIDKFGGSKIYSRISANKIRSIAAVLRELYTAQSRPWGLSPSPVPDLDGTSLEDAIREELKAELHEVAAAGQLPKMEDIIKRVDDIRDNIIQQRRAQADKAARDREDVLDDYLQAGGFYQAFWDFLLDLATFPFAVLKGPSVEFRSRLSWQNMRPTIVRDPHLYWERCSPFDVYFAPWSKNPNDGYVIHYQRVTRASLQALRNLPSYNNKEIDAVLSMDQDEFKEWKEYIETERADLEDRLPDNWNSSSNAVDRPYPMIEFHGPVSRSKLLEWGMPAASMPKGSDDLDVICYLIGRHVIGTRINPHPLNKKPFYVDSYERVPGSLYGKGVPGLIGDIQQAANAALRALLNNLAISSGPQVVVNTDRLSDSDTDLTVYPWKVWGTKESLYGNNANSKPLDFFQPDSNAQELLTVYNDFMKMADTFSGMPRFMQGDATGMATLGRSASGLSMMMNAANRSVKQVVISIDNTILKRVIEDLNLYVSLFDPDASVGGDIDVTARGASALLEREALRQRRLEFLQITSNPTDAQLVGPGGRYELLRAIAEDLQLPIAKVFSGATAAAHQAQQPGAPGQAPGAPGQQPAIPGQQPGIPQAQPGPPNPPANQVHAPGAPATNGPPGGSIPSNFPAGVRP